MAPTSAQAEEMPVEEAPVVTVSSEVDITSTLLTSNSHPAVLMDNMVYTLDTQQYDLTYFVGFEVQLQGVITGNSIFATKVVTLHDDKTIYETEALPVGGDDSMSEPDLTHFTGQLTHRSGKTGIIRVSPELHYGMNISGRAIFLDHIEGMNLASYTGANQSVMVEVRGKLSYIDGQPHLWVEELTINN